MSDFSVDMLLDAAAARIESLERSLKEAQRELDDERMKLACCGVAAQQNTRMSRELHRLPEDSPYRCASYDDVCAAVDREIAERERADAALREAEEHKRDAQRLDWLQQNVSAIRDIGWLDGDLRAAIDAALAEKGKP